jgi:hypothetical protein
MEHEVAPMLFVMFIAGLLANMNVYTTGFDDMRWSLNDVYMSLMMCGWMFLIWGIVYQTMKHTIIGIMLLAITFYGIRTQFLISPNQYIKGMIPHHSMAVQMSKELLKNQKPDSQLANLANTIMTSQQQEINLMKTLEK